MLCISEVLQFFEKRYDNFSRRTKVRQIFAIGEGIKSPNFGEIEICANQKDFFRIVYLQHNISWCKSSRVIEILAIAGSTSQEWPESTLSVRLRLLLDETLF